MSWARVERTAGERVQLVVERWAGSPAWRVEASMLRGHVTTRVVVGGEASAWFLIDDFWEEMLALTSERAPRALRALAARDVEAAARRGQPGTPAWASWWTGRLADALLDAPHSPMAPGRWELSWEDAAHVSAEHFARFVARETFYPGVIPTRAMPWEDSGRVKFWRKHARAGTLPPLVLVELDYLGLAIVDGHARAAAASAEGIEAPRVVLRRLEWREFDEERASRSHGTIEAVYARRTEDSRPFSEATVRGFNHALIESHARGWVTARARAWPLVGGATAWTDEVIGEASRLEDPELRAEALGTMTWMRDQGWA